MEEKKFVSINELDKETEKIHALIMEKQKKLDLGTISGELVSVTIYDGLFSDRPINAEVNWGCLGTCSIAFTEHFIDLLVFVTKLAKEYKYNGYYVNR